MEGHTVSTASAGQQLLYPTSSLPAAAAHPQPTPRSSYPPSLHTVPSAPLLANHSMGGPGRGGAQAGVGPAAVPLHHVPPRLSVSQPQTQQPGQQQQLSPPPSPHQQLSPLPSSPPSSSPISSLWDSRAASPPTTPPHSLLVTRRSINLANDASMQVRAVLLAQACCDG